MYFSLKQTAFLSPENILSEVAEVTRVSKALKISSYRMVFHSWLHKMFEMNAPAP